ncbi:hypothetical protein, partial [Ovoidimarina sediminis]|uniref:hypothetical protein n=1 Tax=Ovoidimarina sediminis TaxID=3079856 RepID=UPI002931DBE5
AGQVCFDGCFVNEDNAFRPVRHGGYAMPEPVVALSPYPSTASLGGDQRLFLYVKPSLRRNRPMASGWA